MNLMISSCPPDGIVLDPFAGLGTTLKVALELGRNAIGIEFESKVCRDYKEESALAGRK